MKLLAFDLEISRPFMDGEWRGKDLGVSCIGLASVDGDERDAWTMTDADSRHGNRSMKPEGLDLFLDLLSNYAGRSYEIISWNGLGFDFPMLLEYVEQRQLCKALALAHYDLAFQMFCAKGFMIGLDAAAQGMGLAGKLPGMRGEIAPSMWSGVDDAELAESLEAQTDLKPGSIEAQDRVLKYVQQDAVTTLEVIEKANEYNAVRWISHSGRPQRWSLPGGNWSLLTVAECLALPEPDTSWMSEPRTRDEYAGWLA